MGAFSLINNVQGFLIKAKNPKTKVQTLRLCSVPSCPFHTVMELLCLLQKLRKYAQIFKSLLSWLCSDGK